MASRVVEITPEQATILRNLEAALVQATRDRDVALTAILAGHGITDAAGFTLAGTTLTVDTLA